MTIELLEDNLDETVDKIIEDETKRSNSLARAEGFFLGFVIGAGAMTVFMLSWLKWGGVT